MTQRVMLHRPKSVQTMGILRLFALLGGFLKPYNEVLGGFLCGFYLFSVRFYFLILLGLKTSPPEIHRPTLYPEWISRF